MSLTADASPLLLDDEQQRHHTPEQSEFLREALAGLLSTPKTLPCKYFYDEHGSALFDAICELEEYYPTRTELAIMQRHVAEMAKHIEPGDVLVELGSGSSVKTRLLLDVLPFLGAYVPVDISREHLEMTAERLRFSYPELTVAPVAADYTELFAVPVAPPPGRHAIAYFPGSTIGNFAPAEAVEFLSRIRALCGEGSRLLIGIDLRKDESVLNAAYNDARGITAAFNMNLLARLNRELGADFNLDCFAHQAGFNAAESRIEMHLVSLGEQEVHLGGQTIRFTDGETIWTESSYKHTLAAFQELAAQAGYRTEAVWSDPREWFSVQMLVS